MISRSQTNAFILISVALAMLIVCVSLVGIYSPDFYAAETLNWQVQSLGQDIIDLVLVAPVLVVTTLLTLKNRKIGFPIWAGIMFYLVYTFAIYSFAVHFNQLFVFYCLILGVSFYAFIYFGYTQLQQKHALFIESIVAKRVIGIYFIVIAMLFYFLWLAEIVPAIQNNTIPKNLMDAGLPTNPVHVIDLAIVLPGIFMTGVLLLRNKKLGLVFTPVLLVFFILMDITIGALSPMMLQKGLEGSFVLTGVMSALAFLSFVLLIWYLKSAKNASN
jgi:hypothetical protein